MWIEVYELNAFTKDGAGGNPAGVVLESVGLTEEDMREIARIVGFSETALYSHLLKQIIKLDILRLMKK
jgi:PhzF family phenazine biosynthesis protein